MKMILLVLVIFLSGCSHEVPKGELNRIYEGIIIMTLDGNSYTCHYINEMNYLSLQCRQNVNRK